MKIAVYTTIFGEHGRYVPLKIPRNLSGYDFIPFLGNGSRLDSRRIKMLPHRYLSEYDVSIWVDALCGIEADIIPVIKKYLKDADIAVLSHPGSYQGDTKRYSIYEEAERCRKLNRGDYKKITTQVSAYRKEGCPNSCEVVATTCVIRRHNKANIIKFDEAWWKEINKHSIRDQISFSYLAWKQGLKYNKIYKYYVKEWVGKR